MFERPYWAIGTLVTDRVFDAFRGGKAEALYYGHTFCGHPLGADHEQRRRLRQRFERGVQREGESDPVVKDPKAIYGAS